jgi:hypothetical protein
MTSKPASEKSPGPTQTVYCVALEGETAGGVDWYRDAASRSAKRHDATDVCFDLDVPQGASRDEITALADQAAWGKWYDAGLPDCRKVAGTPSAHVLEVDFLSVWEEGNVTSKAKLHLASGRVFDIAQAAEGEDYVKLLTENIVIGTKVIPVVRDGDSYRVSADHLATLKGSQSAKYEPGTGIEVDFHGKPVIGIVKADFNALNEVLVNVAGTVYGFHDTQILRTVTSNVLAERYPVKGSMPPAVVQQLYALREAEVERLSQHDVIVVGDLQGLDRGGRCMVASELFDKCDHASRHALLHDEHPHVRSCAAISKADLQTVS